MGQPPPSRNMMGFFFTLTHAAQTVPAHGRQVAPLGGGGGVGGALADPAAVRQQRVLLLHLVQDLLPLRLCLRHGLLALLLSTSAARHCAQRGEINSEWRLGKWNVSGKSKIDHNWWRIWEKMGTERRRLWWWWCVLWFLGLVPSAQCYKYN